MRLFEGWPTALIRKWLTLALIGLGCLAVGVVMLIAVHDMTLFYMSLVLTGLMVGRCALLYRMIGRGAFESVEGVCVSISRIPFQRMRRLCLLTADGEECTVLLEAKITPQIGAWYRAYLLNKAFDKLEPPMGIGLGYPVALAIEALEETGESDTQDKAVPD